MQRNGDSQKFTAPHDPVVPEILYDLQSQKLPAQQLHVALVKHKINATRSMLEDEPVIVDELRIDGVLVKINHV